MTPLALPDGWFLRDGVPHATWHWLLDHIIACNRPIRILGPVCSSHGCATLATWRVWWPSDRAGGEAKCDLCAQASAMVASAMGFVVPVQPIEVRADVRLMMLADHRKALAARDVPPSDDAALRFAAMELD